LKDNVVPSYIYRYFSSKDGQKALKAINASTSLGAIYKNDVKSLYLPFPKYAEQQRIASALTSVDNLLSSLDKLIAKKRDIKQGAMQQLLTGKTRLKGFNAPWDNVKIGNVCAVKRGVRVVRSQLSDNGMYPVYQNTNIPLGYFDKFNVDAYTPFVIVGGSAGQVGFSKTKFWAADDCAYLFCGNSVSDLFIYYELLFQQNIILSKVRYGSVPRLDRTAIVNLEIGIPSFEEQCKIAEVLTSMDNEIAALEAKREKYEAVKQGMMQQLLTGKIRLI
jgi:type I restriction enzyme S subunit